MAPPLDTNIIIRYLVDDPAVSDLAAGAFAFLQRLETSDETARLTEGVLVEAVQVLSSRNLYNQPRPEIQRRLAAIIGLRGVELPNKRLYLRALNLYAATPSLDFVDALLVAYAEREPIPAVVSFDTDFDRVPGIARIAPSAPPAPC
jgi:predicted nucleic acid-binding protein